MLRQLSLHMRSASFTPKSAAKRSCSILCFLHFSRTMRAILTLAAAAAVLCLPLLAKDEREPRAGARFASILEKGRIRVGIQNEYRPFRIENPKPGYPGIDVELAEALGKALGVQVDFVFLSLDDLLRETGKGTVDIGVGGVTATLERARIVHFSDPYMTTTPAALLSRDALPPESESVNYTRRPFKSLADLKYTGRLTIGVRAGTSNAVLLASDEEFKKHNVRIFPDRTEALQALEKREIEALVADDIYIRALLLKRPELATRFLPLTDVYVEDHISVMLPRGDAEFWNYLNFFIKDMKRTGRIQAITRKYMESSNWF